MGFCFIVKYCMVEITDFRDFDRDTNDIMCRVFQDTVDSIYESEVFDTPCLEKSENEYRVAIYQFTGKYYTRNGRKYTLHRIMHCGFDENEDIFLQICIKRELHYVSFLDMWESCAIENKELNRKVQNCYNGARIVLPKQDDNMIK